MPNATLEVSSPANIAFLKYWGKSDAALQTPASGSLSLTLNSCRTIVRAGLFDSADHHIEVNGEVQSRSSAFTAKAFRHLDFLAKELGFSERLFLQSHNTFPPACGIASSASAFSALTLAAVALWTRSTSFDALAKHDFTRGRLAALARQGSGSACRSLWGGYVQWLCNGDGSQSVVPRFSETHWELHDTVVLINTSPKDTASSLGHLSAWTSPLFLPRLAGIAAKERRMIAAIEACDMAVLGPLLEEEALELHAVMLSSLPRINYLGEKTSAFLAWLRKEREVNGTPIYFTIDAGPNVHLIGEPEAQRLIQARIKEDFPEYSFIADMVGAGPEMRTLK